MVSTKLVALWTFWMTENNFLSHFSLFRINTQLLYIFFFFTKLPPAAILDDRKSLSIAFLAISDQYATFIFWKFLSQNGRRRPFWMIENHFRLHFAPFQINTQLSFNFFSKWPPAVILEVRFGPFWMTENHFRSHFSPFQINRQL